MTAALQVEDKRVRLDCGASVQVRWLRQPVRPESPQPLLVFLHEALGSVAMWKEVPEQIARASGCDALLYDRLGHGASDPLPKKLNQLDYLEKESGQILPELLSACGAEQVVLIGHSDGATIALMAAARLPRQVQAVIAEAPHLFVEDRTREGVHAAGQASDLVTFKTRVARYHQQSIEPIFNRWQRIWLDPEFSRWTIEPLMPGIRCPVLALQGEEDEFGTPRQLEAIAGSVAGPVTVRLLPDCRHVPHFQAPQHYRRELLEFLARQGIGPTPTEGLPSS